MGDTDQPIDITSDRVETDTKDSLITFKGNVTARQRDMVIYADFVEAIISQDGKAIEKVTAGGNVKIQQGLRVANCEKAVYYNLERRWCSPGNPGSGKARIWSPERKLWSTWIGIESRSREDRLGEGRQRFHHEEGAGLLYSGSAMPNRLPESRFREDPPDSATKEEALQKKDLALYLSCISKSYKDKNENYEQLKNRIQGYFKSFDRIDYSSWDRSIQFDGKVLP